MKRTLCLILVFCILFALTACYTEPGNSIRWSLEDGVLTVKDTDPLDRPDPYNHEHDVVRVSQWDNLRDEIHTLRLDSSITAIGAGAFSSMQNLSHVEWSDCLAFIGKKAFSSTSLMLNSLPESLIQIGAGAFSGCTLPRIFTIPAAVEEIGDVAFSDCPNVEIITFDGNPQEWGKSIFSGCTELKTIRLPDTLGRVTSRMFENCQQLQDIVLPETVTEIEHKAFSGCRALESIILPAGTEHISLHAFEHCSALSSVTLNEGLENIGEWAFQGCTALKAIHLPATLETLHKDAFLDCTALTKFTVEPGSPYFTADEPGLLYEDHGKSLFLVPMGMTGTLTVSSGTEVIDGWSFYHSQISTVILPDTVSKIDRTAFECSTIQDLYIPTSVTEIGHRIFSGCGNLQHIYYAGTRQQFEQIEGSEEFLTDYGSWLVFETPAS